MPNFSFNFAGQGAINATTVNATTITATGRVSADDFRAAAGLATDTAYGFAGIDNMGMYTGSGKLLLAASSNVAMELTGSAVATQGAVSLNSQGAFKLGSGIIVSLTANQNNWDPASGSVSTTWEVTPDAARTVTGIAATATAGSRVIVLLCNLATNPVFTISLTHLDAASTAANQIRTPSGAVLIIPAGGAALIQYDVTLARNRAYPLF